MRASWLLAAVGLLLAGCTDSPAADDQPPAPEEAAPVEPGDERPVSPARVEEECGDYENRGSMVTLNDEYVVTDGAGQPRVYQESNGFAGLQTEETCPETPDLRQA